MKTIDELMNGEGNDPVSVEKPKVHFEMPKVDESLTYYFINDAGEPEFHDGSTFDQGVFEECALAVVLYLRESKGNMEAGEWAKHVAQTYGVSLENISNSSDLTEEEIAALINMAASNANLQSKSPSPKSEIKNEESGFSLEDEEENGQNDEEEGQEESETEGEY